MKEKKCENLETHPTTPRARCWMLGMLKLMLDEGKTATANFLRCCCCCCCSLVLFLLLGCDRYAMFSVYFVRGRYLLFSSTFNAVFALTHSFSFSFCSTDSLAVSVWLFGRLVFYLFACYSFLLILYLFVLSIWLCSSIRYFLWCLFVSVLLLFLLCWVQMRMPEW